MMKGSMRQERLGASDLH